MSTLSKRYSFNRVVMGSTARPNDANEHVMKIGNLIKTWEYVSGYDSKYGEESMESLTAHKRHFFELLKQIRQFHSWLGDNIFVGQLQELLMLTSLAEQTCLEMTREMACGEPVSKVIYTRGEMPKKKTKKKEKEEAKLVEKEEPKTIEKEKSKVFRKPHEKKKRETRKMINKK